MDVSVIICELLRSGIKTEMNKWGKVRYRNSLRKHILALYRLQKYLYVNDDTILCSAVNKYLEDYGEGYEKDCFTVLSCEQVDASVMEKERQRLEQIIDEMFRDLVKESNKFFFHNMDGLLILRVLWILFENYLIVIKDDKLKQEGAIPELWALGSAAGSMNNKMRKKYFYEEKYLQYDNEIMDIFKDCETKEKVYCPLCNEELAIQRSDDWTKLYTVFCYKCGLGMKVN